LKLFIRYYQAPLPLRDVKSIQVVRSFGNKEEIV
jgi:hypothetical protein